MHKPNMSGWCRLAVLATPLILAACATVPLPNAELDSARTAVDQARRDPRAVAQAPLQLRRAEDFLTRAEAAWRDKDSAEEISHFAYLSRTHALAALETGRRQANEDMMRQLSADRDRAVLQARTQQAVAATARAEQAQQAAQSATQAAQAAQMTAAQQAEAARAAQMSAAQQAEAARAAQATAAAQAARAATLEQQLQELAAKQTQRGLVVTLGDVLFDSGRAELREGARRSIERLAQALRDNPQRRVLIEGFTDSQGSDSFNMQLAERRAMAVRDALAVAGVPADRIAVRAFGEAYPVASNATPEGRQQNRRVEVIFSNERGEIPPR